MIKVEPDTWSVVNKCELFLGVITDAQKTFCEK